MRIHCDAKCDAAGIRAGQHGAAHNDRARCHHSGCSGFDVFLHALPAAGHPGSEGARHPNGGDRIRTNRFFLGIQEDWPALSCTLPCSRGTTAHGDRPGRLARRPDGPSQCRSRGRPVAAASSSSTEIEPAAAVFRAAAFGVPAAATLSEFLRRLLSGRKPIFLSTTLTWAMATWMPRFASSATITPGRGLLPLAFVAAASLLHSIPRRLQPRGHCPVASPGSHDPPPFRPAPTARRLAVARLPHGDHPSPSVMVEGETPTRRCWR